MEKLYRWLIEEGWEPGDPQEGQPSTIAYLPVDPEKRKLNVEIPVTPEFFEGFEECFTQVMIETDFSVVGGGK